MIAAGAGILFMRADELSTASAGEFEWNPERSLEGPITVFASGADRKLYVYRNGTPIGRAAPHIDNPAEPLGDHAFTMLDGFTGVPSEFAPGREGRPCWR